MTSDASFQRIDCLQRSSNSVNVSGLVARLIYAMWCEICSDQKAGAHRSHSHLRPGLVADDVEDIARIGGEASPVTRQGLPFGLKFGPGRRTRLPLSAWFRRCGFRRSRRRLLRLRRSAPQADLLGQCATRLAVAL